MTKLTKSINKLTHDRHRNDSYDDRYVCRHDPRKSARYPNCPESQIEEQMDEIVQSSVNILKNVNKCLNK